MLFGYGKQADGGPAMDILVPIALSMLIVLGLVGAIAGYESRDGYQPRDGYRSS